ncbi:alpha-crystallin B chain [Garra rufa]|uniref:alpha-crystallin B chain n=1 Tax=Garra rufa TaxID=137080 RepID=UPI003CCECA0C
MASLDCDGVKAPFCGHFPGARDDIECVFISVHGSLQQSVSSWRLVTAPAPSVALRSGPDCTAASRRNPPSASVDTMVIHWTSHPGPSPLGVAKLIKCFVGYQSDEESFGGYHGEHQYAQAGNQIDWGLGDNIQVSAPSSSGVGVVRAMGDSYFLSADVSGFEPHEVVLLAYNQCVVIHAEKMAADGSVAGRFTHKSVLPADMDPLSVSSSLTAEMMLIISVGRRKSQSSTLKLTSDLPGSQLSGSY